MRRRTKNGSLFLLAAVECLLVLLRPGASRAAEPNHGLKGRLFVGYQGWFACPGDYQGNTQQWSHWFLNNTQDANHLTVDFLPSLRLMDPKDLCETSLQRPDGTHVPLYSAQNPHVVATHFKWMEDHGIDGAAMQRFVAILPNRNEVRRFDHVLQTALAAAESHGRGLFITYDVSGANPQTVANDLRRDWKHLVDDLKITDSPAYVRAKTKPVLELWGFGFATRPGEAVEVLALIRDLKDGAAGLRAVTLIGGVPTNWRALTKDSKSDPAWAQVYRSYDVISPWAVGRFTDDAGADSFLKTYVLPDMAETARLGIDYMPVIFAGFSASNRERAHGRHGILNQIPRHCGNFMWHQVWNLLRSRADMLYAAMFDEVDEGTALLPVETRGDKLPVGSQMAYLDQDGCSLPDDWYLRVTGAAAGFVRRGQVPPPDLRAVIGP